MDDSSSQDEHEFPGLYEKGKKSNQDESIIESNSNDSFEKQKKSLKNKADKKDRQSYETLGADSDEETTEGGSKLFRSPSKSKKSKTFKFPTSSKKEKREKSRDPEVKDIVDSKEKKGKDKHKEKEHKEKEKKEKKDKKDKSKSGNEVFELGDIQPIFGVSLGLSVERSRCHDGVKLPLVVRDCIDYLQENLTSEQIYKVEGVKTRVQHLKKIYNNREARNEEFDVPTASSLLKTFIQELPEPILTTELITRFEEVSSLPDVTQQAKELEQLIEQLPKCNQVLLAWLSRHFSEVINNGKANKMNAQNLSVLLSPILQMSHRLLMIILCHAETLFADVQLHKYIPPIAASTSPNLPETVEEIQFELRKQESFLNQIHSEMNAGFVTKKREEDLWETQRIITQLKRKLRTFEKKHDSMQKSMDADAIEETIDFTLRKPENDENPVSGDGTEDSKETSDENSDKIYMMDNGMIMLPKDHPDYAMLIKLQLENQELMNWKQQLQSKISLERAECVCLKTILDNQQPPVANTNENQNIDESEYEKLIEHYMKENSLLEQKRLLLAKEIFDENLSLIQLQVELAMKQFLH
ncbi:hypothetical protein PVAND_015927 [Polypedilum vanderplanki]|uniref:Rho-GAP domain-containing protein n=1 Tax=Polypedilum vanderplanki TaxID=319348 RepID=A0A9J6BEE0_POLVA|nr:hypothetical protein PVAND_015927 [Polypedilum vanderplanki]